MNDLFQDAIQPELRIFNFNGIPVRAQLIHDEPMFCLADVCKVLGIANASDCKSRMKPDGVAITDLIDSMGRTQQATFINEQNLYRAIFQSRKPEAEKFTDWVTGEVLPSIRKHGGYIRAGAEESDETIMARALQIAQATIERSKARLAEANREIAALAPDAEYARDVLAAANLHTVNSIAVHLGISAIRLNKFLVEQGCIYKQGDIYCPSCKIRNRGLCNFHVVPYINREGDKMTREHLKWTEEGRRFIIELWNRNRKGA